MAQSMPKAKPTPPDPLASVSVVNSDAFVDICTGLHQFSSMLDRKYKYGVLINRYLNSKILSPMVPDIG